MFESRGRVMSDNNRRQADIPIGASPIPQMPGTAPGLICPVGDKVIYAVPGVPHEMREMMLGTILPDLRRRSGQTTVIRSRVLRTWGHSESGLAEVLAKRIEELDTLGTATLAFLASGIEGIKVRITVKADDEAVAQRVLAAEEALVRGLLGDVVFGIDEQSMEAVVIEQLRREGRSLAVAELLTGGIMASRLTAIEGADAVLRGVRVMANGALGPGYRSGAERAAAAADQVRLELGADIGIAAVAPEEAEGLPRGTIFLDIATADGHHAVSVAVPGDRNRYRNYAVISLLNFLRKAVLNVRAGRAA
jgi:nicotinamide-nucleotide amidase